MIEISRIQKILAEHPGEKMIGSRLAAAAGMELGSFYKHVPRMVKRGLISRIKVKDGGCAFYRYYMDPHQVRVYQLRKSLLEARKSEPVSLVVEIGQIMDRLTFLKMLKERTVFGEHPALQRIILDYERSMKLRHSLEERV